MLTAQSLGRAVVCALVAGATFGAENAAAQVDYEIMSALQFNFSNPGARSLALAGALTGAGDDATGAWTNPGGLTNISRAEIGFEYRRFNYSTLFVNQGRFDGQVTNIGVDTLPPPIIAGESNDQTNALSFVSAVIPRSRWAFAFYRTELANFETAIRTEGVFFDQNNQPQRLLPVDGVLDIKIANYGGSFAVRASDQFSLGVGLSIYDFSLDSVGLRYRAISTSNINLAVQPGFFFGPPLRTAANVLSTETIEGDDTAFGVNVGASINPSEKVRFGASYRQGPKFDISYERTVEGTLDTSGESTFQVPDVYAFGALIKPTTSLNLTFDYRYVRYSQLTEDMAVVISDLDGPEDYVIDDANEIRLAGEYLFTNLPFGVLALRGGAWFDPDHRIRFEGDARNKADTILFPPGEDEWHVTGGGGLVLSKVQIDVGYDHSERVKTFSISGIYRF
jgi:long-chain fatty acid transport protein